MPLHPKALESPISCFHGLSVRQPAAFILPFNLSHSKSVFTCKGVEFAVPKLRSAASNGRLNHASLPDWKLRSVGVKDADLTTLGNLCVDIVLNVPQLPPPSREERKAYMERLAASPPDEVDFCFLYARF